MFIANLYHKSKSYHFLVCLLGSIILGAIVGFWLGPKAQILKPLGDIFLNLMFTIVIPLVFFSVASAVAAIGELKYMGNILFNMLGTFIFTSIVAAIFMLIVVHLFPLGQNINIPLPNTTAIKPISFAEQLVGIITVPDFIKLFSRDNMLALIFFSFLVGVATVSLGSKGQLIANILSSGQELFMKLINYIMYYAPIGFFAYFAVLIGSFGSTLLSAYLHVTVIYYVAALIYFIVAFTSYAYLADKIKGVKTFWKNVSLPAITALATCSSAASIPANLQATKKMAIPTQIYELVVPLGSMIHKDGSTLGGIAKIAFLFGLFHMNFSTPHVLLLAGLVGILVGTVMGAIPSGGMVGEMLILSVYGFPPQALIIIATISILIDPPATMLNVTCNTVSSMLVTRLVKKISVTI